jgi:hypothetical protein
MLAPAPTSQTPRDYDRAIIQGSCHHICECLCACMHACVSACMYACICVSTCMYACMFVQVYVCMHVSPRVLLKGHVTSYVSIFLYCIHACMWVYMHVIRWFLLLFKSILSTYVYIYTYEYIYLLPQLIHICMHVCLGTYTHTQCTWPSASLHTYIRTYTHTHTKPTCLHTYIHVHSRAYTTFDIHTYTYIYTYIHTYIHTHSRSPDLSTPVAHQRENPTQTQTQTQTQFPTRSPIRESGLSTDFGFDFMGVDSGWLEKEMNTHTAAANLHRSKPQVQTEQEATVTPARVHPITLQALIEKDISILQSHPQVSPQKVMTDLDINMSPFPVNPRSPRVITPVHRSRPLPTEYVPESTLPPASAVAEDVFSEAPSPLVVKSLTRSVTLPLLQARTQTQTPERDVRSEHFGAQSPEPPPRSIGRASFFRFNNDTLAQDMQRWQVGEAHLSSDESVESGFV